MFPNKTKSRCNHYVFLTSSALVLILHQMLRTNSTVYRSARNLKYQETDETESDQTGSDIPELSFSNNSGRNSRAGKVSAPQPAYQRSKVSAPQPAYQSRNRNSRIEGQKKAEGDQKSKAPQRVGKTDEETRHKDKSWLDKRRKDQNKAKLGNHNRKAMSDRKKASGML